MSGKSTTRIHRDRRALRERGQGLIEFVLVLPLLGIIILAIVQFGVLYNNYETLTNATRAGARVAAVSSTSSCPGTTEQSVRDASYGLDASQLTVSVPCPWTTGGQLSVTATYPYSIDLMGLVVKSGTLTSTTKERHE
jgi:Flp pilus assembly protein TadG